MQLEQDVPHPPGTNTVDFHRKQFFAERIGWGAMALFLSWALLGGFGDGWLSHRQFSNAERSVAIDYQSIGRRDSPMELRLRVQSNTNDDKLMLHVNREFLDGVMIEQITPQNHSMVVDGDGAELAFGVEPGSKDYEIRIEYKPKHVRTLHIALRIADLEEIAIDQFIYP
jgi:hypothetical protein